MRSAVEWEFWLVFAKIKVGEKSLQNFTITLHKLYTSFTKRLNTLKWALKHLLASFHMRHYSADDLTVLQIFISNHDGLICLIVRK